MFVINYSSAYSGRTVNISAEFFNECGEPMVVELLSNGIALEIKYNVQSMKSYNCYGDVVERF